MSNKKKNPFNPIIKHPNTSNSYVRKLNAASNEEMDRYLLEEKYFQIDTVDCNDFCYSSNCRVIRKHSLQ